MNEILRAPVTDASVWTGADVRAADDWVDRLTADEIEDIEHAPQMVEAKGLDPHCDNSDTTVLLCVERASKGGKRSSSARRRSTTRSCASTPNT